MLNTLETLPTRPTHRPIRTVTVVSRNPDHPLCDTLLRAVDHDVVFVESIAHAYSQIKRVTPDLVIVCVSSDDADGLRVLSMLALDRETSRIPVVTYLASPSEGASGHDREALENRFGSFSPISTN